jgi:ubiquinone/menaquinone biosynthesis C-methylase UbiE
LIFHEVPRGVVLELGCGNGKTASALVRGGAEVIGLDFSKQGLNVCAATLPDERLHLVRGDVRSLPFRDGSFDHVVAFHVLGHLAYEERTRAVSDVQRVLRPGGELLLRVFSTRDMRCGKGSLVEHMTFLKGNGIPCHFFEEDEILALLAAFHPLSLDEVASTKRFDGQDFVRSELIGRFRLPAQR